MLILYLQWLMLVSGKTSWADYIGSPRDHKLDPRILDVEGIDEILSFNNHFHQFFNNTLPIYYLLDYRTGKYIMMSKSCKSLLGYNADFVKSAGVYFAMENYHNDFLKVYGDRTFSDRLKFIKNVGSGERSRYIFSHNFKLKAADGEYKNLVQRSCFIESDDTGNPLLSMGMVVNINQFGKENVITEVIEKISEDNTATEVVKTEFYFFHEEDQLLTKREKEILGWIAEGLTSKQIADKLYISEYTVINHRRNMMEKTNSQNITELVKFAIRNHII